MKEAATNILRPIVKKHLIWLNTSRDLQLFRKIVTRYIIEHDFSFNTGHFAYIDDSFRARLESPSLPWKPLHQSVGLCLRFNYLMPAKSKPTLKVYLRYPNKEKPILVWQLVGSQGEEWSKAQVTWPGARRIQVTTSRLL